MDNEKVSVVVPVYNVEKYIERCIESIISQTYGNLEILLVDDGSTDASGKICDSYLQKDIRIKVFHKSNGGLADARNFGIKSSTADMICFIDSDDWIASNCIEILYNNLKRFSADISIAGLKKQRKYYGNRLAQENNIKLINNLEAVEMYLYQRISPSACGKLYKKDLFDDVEYPIGQLYEDVETSYHLIQKSEKVVVSDANVYNYFSRQGSIVKSDFTLKKMDYYYTTQRLLQCVKRQYPSLEQAAISRMLWAEIHLIVKMNNQRNNFPKENQILWDDIKKYRYSIIMDSKVRKINKAVLIISILGQGILCFVYKVV